MIDVTPEVSPVINSGVQTNWPTSLTTECPSLRLSLSLVQEIRYFKADGKLSYLIETAKAAVSGDAASGGKMVIINHDEIQLASQLHKKHWNGNHVIVTFAKNT